jgi:hypothetical protein
LNKKEIIDDKNLVEYLKKTSAEIDLNLIKEADKLFDSRIKEAQTEAEIKKVIESGAIARVNFCSVGKDGEKCAEIIEKNISAQVRGTKLEKELPFGNKKCSICGKPAKEVVYIARQY